MCDNSSILTKCSKGFIFQFYSYWSFCMRTNKKYYSVVIIIDFIWFIYKNHVLCYIYLGFYVAFKTEKYKTFSWTTTGSFMGRGNHYIQLVKFCTVNCQPSVGNYQLSHIGCGVWTPDIRGGRRVSFHCETVASLKTFFECKSQFLVANDRIPVCILIFIFYNAS